MGIIKLLFSMSGRINRMSYVLASMIVGILGYSLSIGFDLASYTNSGQSTGSGSWIVMILCLYAQAAMLTKRIRDTGSSTALVWVYYIGVLLGIPLLLFGLISQIALVVGILLLGIAVIITLYAVFAGSTPQSKDKTAGKSAFAGMEFSNPSASSEKQQTYNEDADAIIANALADRQLAQQLVRKNAQRTDQSTGQRPGGFGKRNMSTFGNR